MNLKRLTFSYDDGVTQDRRLVPLLNRYGMKATFNINSELLNRLITAVYPLRKSARSIAVTRSRYIR